ncbi:MAG: putative cell surface protein, partial [Methanolobus sp. T82-4]
LSEYCLYNIDSSNLVNDRPVYYLVNRSDEMIPSDAGVVYAINSTNITISGAEISNEYYGVLFYNTDNSTIKEVTLSNCYNGVYLSSSNNNNLTANDANSNTRYGIYLSSSSNNTLAGNDASSNVQYGIYLSSSSNNTLAGNDASSNAQYGIYLSSSNNNTLTENIASRNKYSSVEVSSLSIDSVVEPMISLNQAATGFCIISSDNNTLTNNIASYNTGSSGDSVESVLNSGVTPNIDFGPIYSCGFYLYSSDNTTMQDNTAIGNEDYDFYSSLSLNNTVDKLVLTGSSMQLSFVTDLSETAISGSGTSSYSLSGKTNVNGYVDIGNGDNINVTFSYDDSGMSSSAESSIALFKLNGSEWIAVPDASLDMSANNVFVNLSELGYSVRDVSIEYYTSTFGLFKDTPRSSDGMSAAERVRSEGTITDIPVGDDGEVTSDTVVKSSDSITTLTVYKGTKATDSNGDPVNKIIVTTPASLPADTPREVLESGLYYDFGPSGTTFSEAILITMDFNPEDFKDKKPVIYTYTSEDGWVALETTVDWENSKVTAYINHFSLYAVFGTDAEENTEVLMVEAEDEIGESPAIEEDGISTDEEKEDETVYGYLYGLLGIVVVAALGIIIVKKQNMGKRGL